MQTELLLPIDKRTSHINLVPMRSPFYDCWDSLPDSTGSIGLKILSAFILIDRDTADIGRFGPHLLIHKSIVSQIPSYM